MNKVWGRLNDYPTGISDATGVGRNRYGVGENPLNRNIGHPNWLSG